MTSENLYSFRFYCGRMGELTGTFFADPEELAKTKGKTLYFGEGPR